MFIFLEVDLTSCLRTLCGALIRLHFVQKAKLEYLVTDVQSGIWSYIGVTYYLLLNLLF